MLMARSYVSTMEKHSDSYLVNRTRSDSVTEKQMGYMMDSPMDYNLVNMKQNMTQFQV